MPCIPRQLWFLAPVILFLAPTTGCLVFSPEDFAGWPLDSDGYEVEELPFLITASYARGHEVYLGVDNGDILKDGDLLLIDAGCELDYYASDITRTFPVNGRFTPEQRAVYEIVLEAQDAAIEKTVKGNHWNDPHDAAVRVITKGLVDLGLLKGRVATLVKNEAYKRFYMHRTGHWLGMDVHDVGDYKIDGAWRLLEPGMVLTIEPGLYVPPDSRGVPRKWWGIGIRIEDDVLVTREGCEVLSVDAPKGVDDIEALMAEAPR